MNLESLFEKELREYFAAHRDIRPDRLEDAVTEIYKKWSDKPLPELDGKTPRGYVAEISEPDTLVAGALESVKRGGEPSPLFVERIAKLPETAASLIKILESDEKEKLRITAAELLFRLGRVPLKSYAEIVFDPDTPSDLRETLIDQLKFEADGVRDILLERVGETDGGAKTILAELLVSCGVTDDKVFDLLVGMLDEPGCLSYAAQLLAKYGDPRAIEKMTEMSRVCDYADFVELRNSVEMLGGDLPLRFNWEGDVTYKKIKGE